MEDTPDDFKDSFFNVFQLIRDFFAAIGATTVIVAAVLYSWGYFS